MAAVKGPISPEWVREGDYFAVFGGEYTALADAVRVPGGWSIKVQVPGSFSALFVPKGTLVDRMVVGREI